MFQENILNGWTGRQEREAKRIEGIDEKNTQEM